MNHQLWNSGRQMKRACYMFYMFHLTSRISQHGVQANRDLRYACDCLSWFIFCCLFFHSHKIYSYLVPFLLQFFFVNYLIYPIIPVKFYEYFNSANPLHMKWLEGQQNGVLVALCTWLLSGDVCFKSWAEHRVRCLRHLSVFLISCCHRPG